jgi:hypothetical protein
MRKEQRIVRVSNVSPEPTRSERPVTYPRPLITAERLSELERILERAIARRRAEQLEASRREHCGREARP